MQKFRNLLYPALTLCFLLGMLGFFLGRRSLRTIVLTTQHPEATASLSPSLPTDLTESGNPTRQTDAMRIDLNRATLEELTLLPGIGELRAQRILEYRERNGPFRQVTELMNVSGIGEGIFSGLRDYVYVEDDYENTDH